jgi:hypothetical protein
MEPWLVVDLTSSNTMYLPQSHARIFLWNGRSFLTVVASSFDVQLRAYSGVCSLP